ncbi:MAG: hypothetical protein WCK29_03895 [archaeon]
MSLNKELWLKTIEEIIYPENNFYNQSVDHTAQGAIFGKTVHIPNAGAFTTAVVTDPTVFPLTAEQRTDNDLTYNLHTYANVPLFVNFTEMHELSYDKVKSLVYQMTNNIEDKIANKTIFTWVNGLPSTSLVKGTGATRSGGNSYQTGNRSSLAFEDVVGAHKILDQQNVPRNGRKMLVSAQGYGDLMNMTKYNYAFIQLGTILEDGKVGTLLGADVYMRGTYNVAYNTSSATFSEVTTATSSAILSDFSIIWHPDFVSQCKGSIGNSGIQLFERANDPLYLSDVVSCAVRHGSSRVRYDNYGVVAIYEGA